MIMQLHNNNYAMALYKVDQVTPFQKPGSIRDAMLSLMQCNGISYE